jgi:hypothetical protein
MSQLAHRTHIYWREIVKIFDETAQVPEIRGQIRPMTVATSGKGSRTWLPLVTWYG